MAPVSIGVVSVSAETTCTSSVAMPSSSAAICASMVSEPWPVSTVPVSSVAVPSSLTFTTAALGLAATVKPIGYHMQAMPRPRRFMSAGSSPAEALRRLQQRFLDHHAVQHLAGRAERAFVERVEQPDFQRIDAERLGDVVHVRFVGEAHLRRAESAHRAGHGLVGVDDERFRVRGCRSCTGRRDRMQALPSVVSLHEQ